LIDDDWIQQYYESKVRAKVSYLIHLHELVIDKEIVAVEEGS
jgi:hypothetical protein